MDKTQHLTVGLMKVDDNEAEQTGTFVFDRCVLGYVVWGGMSTFMMDLSNMYIHRKMPLMVKTYTSQGAPS